MASISVIIPSRDRSEDLRRAILSVFRQTIVPCQLIIVDDGSITPIPSSIFSKSPKGLDCLLIRNDISRGACFSRNLGLKKSVGDWIAFLDDDDEFLPNKVEVISNFLHASHGIDFFYHPAHVHMTNENVQYVTKPIIFQKSDNVLRRLLIKNEIGGTPMVVIKRSILQMVGGFDESLPALQDYELWIRLAKFGARFQNVGIPLTRYYFNTNQKSISKSLIANKDALKIIAQKFKNDLAGLSLKEIQQHKLWQNRMIIHKALLNKNKLLAFKTQCNQLRISPSLKNFIFALSILSGPKTVFKIRSRFG